VGGAAKEQFGLTDTINPKEVSKPVEQVSRRI
jgi:hypothetical protein